MPVLHKYKNRNEYYVFTMIGRAVATFHLKDEGYKKLAAVGIKTGDTFPRALLLDLYRQGDAYTHEPAAGQAILKTPTRQLRLDFADDPEPATLFPRCSGCPSVADLHVAELKEPEHSVTILCPACRAQKTIDSSIPLPLVNCDLLARLLKIKGIYKLDRSMISFQKLLDAELESSWDELLKHKPQQKKLFDTGENGQQKPAPVRKRTGGESSAGMKKK
jgi:hypothetical protein